MTIIKPILKTTVGLQSIALLGEGLKVAGVNKKLKIKKPNGKKMIKGFVNILTGVALLKPTADIVAGF